MTFSDFTFMDYWRHPNWPSKSREILQHFECSAIWVLSSWERYWPSLVYGWYWLTMAIHKNVIILCNRQFMWLYFWHYREFPTQRASNMENVSIWWCHHDPGQDFQNMSLQWRYNDHDGVSNHQPHHCLLNRLFRRRSRKTSKLRVTGLCVGNSPGPVNSPHKGPVMRKMFPFDDVIMWVEYVSGNTYHKSHELHFNVSFCTDSV